MIFWSQVLAVYLQHYPTSVIAMNLKACNHFKLYNGKAAEQELFFFHVFHVEWEWK